MTSNSMTSSQQKLEKLQQMKRNKDLKSQPAISSPLKNNSQPSSTVSPIVSNSSKQITNQLQLTPKIVSLTKSQLVSQYDKNRAAIQQSPNKSFASINDSKYMEPTIQSLKSELEQAKQTINSAETNIQTLKNQNTVLSSELIQHKKIAKSMQLINAKKTKEMTQLVQQLENVKNQTSSHSIEEIIEKIKYFEERDQDISFKTQDSFDIKEIVTFESKDASIVAPNLQIELQQKQELISTLQNENKELKTILSLIDEKAVSDLNQTIKDLKLQIKSQQEQLDQSERTVKILLKQQNNNQVLIDQKILDELLLNQVKPGFEQVNSGELNAMWEQIDQMSGNAEQQEFTKEIKSLKQQIEANVEQTVQQDIARKLLEKKVSELESLNINLSAQTADLSSKNQELVNQITQSANKEQNVSNPKTTQTYQMLEAEFKLLKQQNQVLTQKLTMAQTVIQEAEQKSVTQSEQFQKHSQDQQTEIEQLSENYQKLVLQNQILSNKLSNIEQNLDEQIQEINAQLESKIQENKTLQEAFQQLNEENEKNVALLKQLTINQNTDDEIVQISTNDFQQLLTSQMSEDHIQLHKEEYEHMIKTIKIQEDELQKLNNTETETQHDNEKLAEYIQQQKSQIEKHEAQIQNIQAKNQQNVQQLNATISELNSQIEECQIQITSKTKQILNLQQINETLIKDKHQLQSSFDEYKRNYQSKMQYLSEKVEQIEISGQQASANQENQQQEIQSYKEKIEKQITQIQQLEQQLDTVTVDKELFEIQIKDYKIQLLNQQKEILSVNKQLAQTIKNKQSLQIQFETEQQKHEQFREHVKVINEQNSNIIQQLTEQNSENSSAQRVEGLIQRQIELVKKINLSQKQAQLIKQVTLLQQCVNSYKQQSEMQLQTQLNTSTKLSSRIEQLQLKLTELHSQQHCMQPQSPQNKYLDMISKNMTQTNQTQTPQQYKHSDQTNQLLVDQNIHLKQTNSKLLNQISLMQFELADLKAELMKMNKFKLNVALNEVENNSADVTRNVKLIDSLRIDVRLYKDKFEKMSKEKDMWMKKFKEIECI
ncbi:Hypothetical_protein [Hexamita inflata]|uniref:Hypothetical_protein n=1 Tax=Hexamita inflata TaxID=28002 RepID=A0AA86R8U8_9EUKA|nr:Hypothetical protein HINF_LOCUS56078 [Hexamita inflata]